jgi:hypothetical protein
VSVFEQAGVSNVVHCMEIEIVGWLADREAAIRAHMSGLPPRRRPAGVTVIAGVVAAVAFIAAIFLSWPSA